MLCFPDVMKELDSQRRQHQDEMRRDIRRSLASSFADADEKRREQVIRNSFYELTGREIDLQEAEPVWAGRTEICASA